MDLENVLNDSVSSEESQEDNSDEEDVRDTPSKRSGSARNRTAVSVDLRHSLDVQ